MEWRATALFLVLFGLLAACQRDLGAPASPGDRGKSGPTAPFASPGDARAPHQDAAPVPLGEPRVTRPPRLAPWQIQFTGPLDLTLNVRVFDLDLFDVPREVIQALHQRGVYVMCYFSAGSWEAWRPDAGRFPPDVVGKPLKEWPGERWLDIRRLDVLAPIMEARLNMAREKGCDGVDPDNVDGYLHDTGFPLTFEDQLAYNRFLAQAAHARGLAIGLKNDLEQIPLLLPDFDWALNEACFSYDECERLLPFVEAGRPVFVIEYELAPEAFCPRANALGFNALLKRRELDAFRVDCREIPEP